MRSSSDLAGTTDFEEPYVHAVRLSSDLGGGITDFEEPYVDAVRSDLGGGITNFDEPYLNAVRSNTDLGGGRQETPPAAAQHDTLKWRD